MVLTESFYCDDLVLTQTLAGLVVGESSSAEEATLDTLPGGEGGTSTGAIRHGRHSSKHSMCSQQNHGDPLSAHVRVQVSKGPLLPQLKSRV